MVLEAPEKCLPARLLPACLLPAKRAPASSAENRKGSLVSAGNLKTNHTNVYTQQHRETGTWFVPTSSWPSGNPGPTEEMSRGKSLACQAAVVHTWTVAPTTSKTKDSVGRQRNPSLSIAWSLGCLLFYSRTPMAKMERLMEAGQRPTEAGMAWFFNLKHQWSDTCLCDLDNRALTFS